MIATERAAAIERAKERAIATDRAIATERASERAVIITAGDGGIEFWTWWLR